jgi:3-isopropylmalate dehydrogenase
LTSTTAKEAVMAYKIAVLPGDGIGPEIMAPTLEILNQVGDFEFEEHLFGGASIAKHGAPLTDQVLAACRKARAILVGAVGGPQWTTTDLHCLTPEKGLLKLRKELGLYTNLRPAEALPGLPSQPPLHAKLLRDVDLMVVRKLTGDVYYGEQKRTATMASSLYIYTEKEVERIAREAFKYAGRGKVTNVDKANALEVGAFWREVVTRVHVEVFQRLPWNTSTSTMPSCSWQANQVISR